MRFSYRFNGQQSPISMFLWMIVLAGLLLVSVSCTENTPLEIIPDGTRPVLSAVTPDVVAFRDTNVVVIFEGEGFVPETIALSRDVVLVSTFIDSTKLEVLMRDEDFAVAEGTSPEPNYRTLHLSVSNISVGGGQEPAWISAAPILNMAAPWSGMARLWMISTIMAQMVSV